MAESVRLLASLAIDGRALRCDHAVLLLDEPPARGWLIALLGVAERDLECLPGRHLASFADSQGECSTAAVESLPASCAPHVRLQGSGRLHESSPCWPAGAASLRSAYPRSVDSKKGTDAAMTVRSHAATRLQSKENL